LFFFVCFNKAEYLLHFLGALGAAHFETLGEVIIEAILLVSCKNKQT